MGSSRLHLSRTWRGLEKDNGGELGGRLGEGIDGDHRGDSKEVFKQDLFELDIEVITNLLYLMISSENL